MLGESQVDECPARKDDPVVTEKTSNTVMHAAQLSSNLCSKSRWDGRPN